MSKIQKNLERVRDKIILAAKSNKRDAKAITLLAVSKGRSCEEIQDAMDAGQLQFGENYLQESLPKIEFFKAGSGVETNRELVWHFIGPLQSNKAKLVSGSFDWVQSVDREKIAILLDMHRPQQLSPLNVCIEVNISGEDSKSGIAPDGVVDLAEKIQALPNLTLRGLMAIPAANRSRQEQRKTFNKLYEIFVRLKGQGFKLDTLSMGMTDDFEAAIAEGATMVRIGRAIFD